MANSKALTLQDVIDQMKETLKEVEERLEQKIDVNTEKVEVRSKSTDSKLDNIEKNTTDLSDSVTVLEKVIDSKDKTTATLEMKIYSLEEDRRKHNLVIEGLSEERNGNRKTLDELFEFLELQFDSEWVNTAFRIGVTSDRTKRPRPVKINFPFLKCKSDVYRNSYKLKRSQKYQKVYLVEDYPQKTHEEIKVMRAKSAFVKSQGIDSKMKGNKILVDSKIYSFGELDKLPHNLSSERAKTVEVEDGVAFQGKYSFLSNHHPCTIRDNDKEYNCSEQMFHYTRAVENNEGGMAHQILKETEPAQMMKLGRKVKETKEWQEKEIPTMAVIIRKKLDQNPHLKDKLCRIQGNIYEATLHPLYGWGFTLAQHKSINNNKKNVTSGNKLGIELGKLRDLYIVNTN